MAWQKNRTLLQDNRVVNYTQKVVNCLEDGIGISSFAVLTCRCWQFVLKDREKLTQKLLVLVYEASWPVTESKSPYSSTRSLVSRINLVCRWAQRRLKKHRFPVWRTTINDCLNLWRDLNEWTFVRFARHVGVGASDNAANQQSIFCTCPTCPQSERPRCC